MSTFLVGVPNLKEQLLGVGMVSAFMDDSTELGQRWQPILTVLRRNRGTLEVNFCHILDDNRDFWRGSAVQANATISLPAKGALPIREIVWALQDLATAAQTWIENRKTVQSVKFQRLGVEGTIWFIGVPQDVVRPIAREKMRKAQAKKLKHARHVREGCVFKDCKAMKEEIKEDRLRRTTPIEKTLRPGQTSARAQLQSKWARQTDLSFDEEDLVEAKGSVSVIGMKTYVNY